MLKIYPEGFRDTGSNTRPLNTKRKALTIHHGGFYTAFYPEEESAWASHSTGLAFQKLNLFVP